MARWAVGLMMLAISLAYIVFNVRATCLRGRTSLAPFVGGISGMLGLLSLPMHLARWCWLPLVLDIGCLPYVSLVLLGVVKNRSVEI